MYPTGRIIVAMTKTGVIGLDGGIPWHYSADLKRFKRLTLKSSIIMGRKTWESLPRRPLPDRQNIVITNSRLPDVEHYSSLDKAIENVRRREYWIIGGASIYSLAIDYCNRMDVTYVPDNIKDPACIYFPRIDWSRWQAGEKVQYEDDVRLYHQEFRIIDEL